MLHRSFKPAKCKTALKLAVSRIKLLNNKREAQVKQMKRELAQLLESGQVQTARIRVEHVIREEKTMTAYNLIEIYCELLAARLPIIESQKNCPIDLKEAITSVVFASPRCADVPELMDIKKHLTAKYGKEFITTAIELRPDCGVNRMLVEKLSAKAPDGPTKLKILTAIAEEHNVKWDPNLFSVNDYTPPQDLLNGPSTFETMNKIHNEAPPVPARPIHDDKGPPNVQAPSRHDEKQDVFVNFNEHNMRTSSGSQNFASTGAATNKATTSPSFHPESRSSGNGTEQVEYKQSFHGNENAFPSGGQNWNMEFTDATSAAQAAAESAERASMAARAAAELSRQYSSESQKSSRHVPKDERPQFYANSKLQRDHAAKDAENNVLHGRNFGIREERIVDKESGAAERFVRDTFRNDDRYNKESSFKSSTTSIDDVRLVNNRPAVDRNSQRKSSEYDNSDFLNEVRKKKQSSDSDSTSVAKKLDSMKSEETAYFDEKVTRKQSSGISRHSHSSSFGDDQEDILRKNDNVAHYADMKTERHSSSSSCSRSSDSGDIHGDIFKRTIFTEDTFVHDERSTFRNTSNINSNENTAVFDDYCSDDDNDILDVGNYKEQETSLKFSSPGKESSKDLFADSTVWSPRRNTDERLGKSTSQSHESVFSEIQEGSSLPVDMPPVAFDVYNSPSSDNEEDFHTSKLMGSKDLHKFPSEKNVNSRSSEPMPSEEHISEASSFSEDRNVGSRRNPWLGTSTVDLQPKEVLRDRRPGIKSSSMSREKFGYTDLPSDQSPSVLMKSGLGSSVKDTPELPNATKDTELVEESTSEIAKELNFGTLTGGLRNKGNRRAPYMRKPSENSLTVKQASEETSSENDQSSSSSTVRSSIGFRAGYQEADSDKSSTKLDKKVSLTTVTQHVDSDDDRLVGERRQETSISKQPYNQKSGSELNEKSSSRASRTYFDSDNSGSEEELPKLTSTSNARPGAGFSRRTKVSTSNSGRTYSKTTPSSLESRTPYYRAESKSSSSSSNVSETLPKPETKRSDHVGNRERRRLVEQESPKPMPSSSSNVGETLPKSEAKRSDHAGNRERHRLVEQDSPKPMPESRRSSRMESSKLSAKEQTSNASNPPVVTRETSSNDSASHVHPKLPDSDAFTAFFQSLRQSRE